MKPMTDKMLNSHLEVGQRSLTLKKLHGYLLFPSFYLRYTLSVFLSLEEY